MNIKELSINNYVKIHKELFKVTRVYEATIEGTLISDKESKVIPYFKDVKPIPITLEFLQKNLFKWNEVRNIAVKTIKDRRISIVKYNDEFVLYDEWIRNDTCINRFHAFIKYIHELQNFLTLCKMKIKLKL